MIDCPECGVVATRLPIYENQSLNIETGPIQFRKAAVPRDQQYLKPKYDRFREASMEVDYAYSKVEASTGQEIRNPMWKRGLTQAQALHKQGVTAQNYRDRSTA